MVFLAVRALGLYTVCEMRRLSAITLLASFCGLALLSMLVMSFSMSNHDGCFTSPMGGVTACSAGISSFLATHFSFFNQFAQAISGSMFAFILLLCAAVLFFVRIHSQNTVFRFLTRVYTNNTLPVLTFRDRAWLALLETSPTFS